MGALLRFIRYILIVICIFVAHVLVLNILPFPFNHINIILMVFFWLTIYNGSSLALWSILPLAFLQELFVSFPFGLTSISLILTTIIMYWVLLNIFTNRSLYIVFLSCFFGLTIYRFSFIMFLLLLNMFNQQFSLSWPEILTNIFYEVILTTAVFFVIYLLSTLIFRRLNTKYIIQQSPYGTQRYL